MRHRQVLLFAVIALGTTVSGCRRGNDLDLQAVSGSVTLDSRLLDSGTMRFVPMAKNGLLGGTTIAAGQYRIPKEKGLPPGKYAVQISAAQPQCWRRPRPTWSARAWRYWPLERGRPRAIQLEEPTHHRGQA